ncbi:MAG: LacI family DNA-binding transcriptional regulator [Christensenellales bacterium]
MGNEKRPTIYDVAKLAGVSSCTVSNVINNSRFVSNNLQERVFKAINALNFSPDSHAKNLRKGVRKIIGIIVPDISNVFFSSFIKKTEEIISESGYNIIVCNTNEKKEKEKKYLKMLVSGLVDGILLVSTFNDSYEISKILPHAFPIILIDRRIENALYDTISIDTYSSVYQGTYELIKKGHRKIGYIAIGSLQISTAKDRLNAFKDGMQNCGLKIEEDIIQYYNIETDNIYSCIDNLLSLNCTAIITSGSYISFKTMLFLELKKKLHLGQNFDLFGFNGFKLCDSEKMSYVDLPINELGIQAGKQIIERINVPLSMQKNIIIPSIYINKQEFNK